MLPHCGLMLPEKLRGKRKGWWLKGMGGPPPLPFQSFLRCLFVSPPLCLPLWAPLLPRLIRSLQLHQEMENLFKGGSRSKSCTIRQLARNSGVLSYWQSAQKECWREEEEWESRGGTVAGAHSKERQLEEVDEWIVTWHISHHNTLFQQSFSLTTLLNIQT